jgi:hypothetical protein
MKPQTAKPSESAMRFFAPELYVRFNSSNEDEADRASEEWDSALGNYRKHLEGIRDLMPSPVRRLAEICLHDAEFLGLDQTFEPLLLPANESIPNAFWTATAIIDVNQNGKIVSLIYLLWDRVREQSSVRQWPFSKARPHWLYDEVDVAPGRQGMFVHRILLSDGRVIEIPFVSALVHTLPVSRSGEKKGIRRSA